MPSTKLVAAAAAGEEMNPGHWEALVVRAKAVRDEKGNGIDPEILPVVVALWAHDVPTAASCAGHEQSAIPHPYVDIEVVQDENQSRDAWIDANFAVQGRVIELLARFYAANKRPGRPYSTMLHPQNWVEDWGGFRLCSVGGQVNWLSADAQRWSNILTFRREMDLFAEFLKEDYLREGGKLRDHRR